MVEDPQDAGVSPANPPVGEIVFEEAGTADSLSQDRVAQRLGPLALLLLSAWCGLVAGLLEVGTLILRKRTIDANQLYQMSRHFVWLIPVTNLGVLLALGIAGGLLIWVWPRRGRGLVARLLCALTWLPMVLVAFPQIYRLAWLIVTLGIAARLVPTLERHAVGVRRLVRLSLPGVAGLVLILTGSLWGFDRLGEWRERARPSPPPGTPNVLLIVMDTVAADHLSLYGYQRPPARQSPNWPARIRFDAARSSSSWTLPSHASMFTGRWPHELSVGWRTPLDATRPDGGRVPGSPGLRHGGLHRQHPVLCR